MWNRILVATGGSPWSDAAVAYAIGVAVHYNVELCLLTVLHTPPLTGADGGMLVIDRVRDYIESEGKERLTQAAARAASAGIVATTVMRWGNTSSAILQTAAEEDCDLIILGGRTLTGWKRLRVGSITNRVTARARQPVLVIKQSPCGQPNVLPWRRILVAAGDSLWSVAAMSYAFSLAQNQQLEVCGLHIQRPQPGQPDIAIDRVRSNLLEVAEALAEVIDIRFESVIVTGNVPDAILATATRQQCNAIVLGSRGLTGWKRLRIGNIANVVVAKATLPVLIVKHFGANCHLVDDDYSYYSAGHMN